MHTLDVVDVYRCIDHKRLLTRQSSVQQNRRSGGMLLTTDLFCAQGRRTEQQGKADEYSSTA